jgi:hypothetical protein
MKNNKPISIHTGLLTILGVILLAISAFLIFIYNIDRGGTYHNSINLADLDNDGDMDVILQNVRNESEFTAFAVLTLWFNQGNGEFTPTRINDYQHEAGWASTAGDVDQDGDADLFIYHGYRLHIDFNEGGEFARNQFVSQPSTNSQFGSLLLGDLNNDNLLDGIVTGCCGRVFTLDMEDDTPNFTWKWINASTPTGNLTPQATTLSALDGLTLSAADLGDLDGDGDLDLFAAVIAPKEGRNTDPSDRIILNDGSGNFADSGQRLGGTDSTSIDLGDIDNDGDLDALIGNENGALVWFNQSDQKISFMPSSQTISGSQTQKVFLSDLDGDGDLDALIAGANKAVIWENDGQGIFTKSDQSFRYTKRYSITIGDFNNDGNSDVFAAEYTDNYKIWYNQGNGSFKTSPPL